MKRHEHLTQRKPENVSRAAATVTKQNIDIWFEKIVIYFERQELLEFLQSHPENVLNLERET